MGSLRGSLSMLDNWAAGVSVVLSRRLWRASLNVSVAFSCVQVIIGVEPIAMELDVPKKKCECTYATIQKQKKKNKTSFITMSFCVFLCY